MKKPYTVITPPRLIELPEYGEIIKHIDLIWMLAIREIKSKHAQTFLSGLWTVLIPLLQLFFQVIIYATLLGNIAKLKSEGIPYPVFILSGALIWNFFTRSIYAVTSSISYFQSIWVKIYAPNMVFILAYIVPVVIEFAIMLIVGILTVGFMGYVPGVRIVLIPVLVAYVVLWVIAIGLWTSALQLKSREVSILLPYILQVWFYCTPVIYSTTVLPEKFAPIINLNPMTDVIEIMRWILLGKEIELSAPYVLLHIALLLMLFIPGMVINSRIEKIRHDIV